MGQFHIAAPVLSGKQAAQRVRHCDSKFARYMAIVVNVTPYFPCTCVIFWQLWYKAADLDADLFTSYRLYIT